MTWFLVRKMGVFVIAALAATALVFYLLRIMGGDITGLILGRDANPEAVANLQQELGLDRPLWNQYLEWVGGLVTGDLGTSLRTDVPVSTMIATRAPVTISIAVLGLFVALLIAVPAGTVAAANYDRKVGSAITAVSQVGVAVPYFWAGVLLAAFFAVRLRWLPAGGFAGWDVSVLGSLRSLVLPVLSLGLVMGAVLTRYVRAAVLDVMSADYVRTARAYGLTPNAALLRHGLRNASIPLVTVIGLFVADLVGGAVIIETVFALPGLGRMLLAAISGRDLILVQSTVMVLVIIVLFINMAVDLAYGWLDPRIRVVDEL